MKKKDLQDYKNKKYGDLLAKIADFDKEKTQAQIEMKMGKVKDVHLASKKKKEIAQLKTIARLKFLSEKFGKEKEEANATG